jgi:hypothetical protein
VDVNDSSRPPTQKIFGFFFPQSVQLGMLVTCGVMGVLFLCSGLGFLWNSSFEHWASSW